MSIQFNSSSIDLRTTRQKDLANMLYNGNTLLAAVWLNYLMMNTENIIRKDRKNYLNRKRLLKRV